jgi:RNA polymerase sigma-70 factor, ECF subfamily
MDDATLQATRLWTLTQPVVSAFVTSVVRNFSDRDDVLQEIAVAVVESFNRYDPSRPFLGWALGIAQKQVGLYLRRVRRDRLVFDEETIQSLAIAFETQGGGPARKLDFLQDCLRHLEGRTRQVCELRYRDDLKPAAIGEAIGMTANSVAKMLQRIRDQLRECVERKASSAGGRP